MGGSVQIRIRYPWAQRLIWIGLIQIRENNLAQSLDPDQPDPDRKTNGEAGTFDFFEIKKSLKKPLEGLFPDPDLVRIFPHAAFPKHLGFSTCGFSEGLRVYRSCGKSATRSCGKSATRSCGKSEACPYFLRT